MGEPFLPTPNNPPPQQPPRPPVGHDVPDPVFDPPQPPPPPPPTNPTPPNVPPGGDTLTIGTNVWQIPTTGGGATLPSMTASVGDTVIFQWNGNHNVYLHPTGTCNTVNSMLIGNNSGASFTFENSGSYVFACQIPQHCDLGMIMTITVS